MREIETVIDNPDAEPAMPCAAAKTAIIVSGKQTGAKLTICTDANCPGHEPEAAAEVEAHPAPTIAPPAEDETEEEAAERQREFEERRAEHEQERQRREEERRQQVELEQAEREAERNRRIKILQTREATFNRILDNAPVIFTAAQWRAFLRALVNLDPYTFIDDVAEYFVGDNENNQQTAEEILLSTLDGLTDDKLTGFGLRLVLAGHLSIPREGELDHLTEVEAVFILPPPKKQTKSKKAATPVHSISKKSAAKEKATA